MSEPAEQLIISIDDVTVDDPNGKARAAWVLKRRGIPVVDIAKKLDISREHASRLANGYLEHLTKELRETAAIDLLAGELADISNQINRAEQFLAALLSKCKYTSDGKREYSERQAYAIQRQERLIAELRKQKLHLTLETGLIPKAPERHQLVQALAAEINVNNETDPDERLTPDQLKEKIISTLSRTKFIQ